MPPPRHAQNAELQTRKCSRNYSILKFYVLLIKDLANDERSIRDPFGPKTNAGIMLMFYPGFTTPHPPANATVDGRNRAPLDVGS